MFKMGKPLFHQVPSKCLENMDFSIFEVMEEEYYESLVNEKTK